MNSATPKDQAEQLAMSRAALMHRLRWLAPNSRRGRELAAEIRRLAREELKLEVAGGAPSTHAVLDRLPRQGEEDEERLDRTRWWDR